MECSESIFLPRVLSRIGLRFTLRLAVAVPLAIGVGLVGCTKTAVNAQTTNSSDPDPADANLAPADPNAQQQQQLDQNLSQAARAPGYDPSTQSTTGQSQQSAQNESQQRADEYKRTGQQEGAPVDAQQQPGVQGYPNYPVDQTQPPSQSYPNQSYPNDPMNEDQVDAGQAAIEANEPPPPLPQYDQPEAPGPSYMWTPGYWYWAPAGYYWVPGAWVVAPYPGALWTPGYWVFAGPYYRWHHGYWGLHIGFYGGINYGCGYTGYGYWGGYWRGNAFYYNRAVNHINVARIPNVYSHTVVVNNTTRVAYNSGRGGIQIQPRPAELTAMRETRTPAMSSQVLNRHVAAQNPAQFYSQNRGRPQTVVASRPLPADYGIMRPQPGAVRQGYVSQPGQQNQPRPAVPVETVRPGYRPGPADSRARPGQPYVQQGQPQAPLYRQEPNVQPRPESQSRPVPEQYHPQAQPIPRPAPEAKPQHQYQQQYRPVPLSEPKPVPESRPMYQPPTQQRPMPMPEYRPDPPLHYRPVSPPAQPQPQHTQQSQPAQQQHGGVQGGHNPK